MINPFAPKPKTAAQQLQELLQEAKQQPTKSVDTASWFAELATTQNPALSSNSLSSANYAKSVAALPASAFKSSTFTQNYQKGAVETLLDSVADGTFVSEVKKTASNLLPNPLDLIPTPVKYAAAALGALLLVRLLR